MYNVLDLCTPIESPYPDFTVGFEADPAAVYPATAARILEILAGDAAAPSNLGGEVAAARNLGPDAFELVGYSIEETDPADLEKRKQALEICRRFFTEALHSAAGYEKMYLHILSNDRFRLAPRKPSP